MMIRSNIISLISCLYIYLVILLHDVIFIHGVLFIPLIVYFYFIINNPHGLILCHLFFNETICPMLCFIILYCLLSIT